MKFLIATVAYIRDCTFRLDILVNNAGAGYFVKQKTDDLLTLMLTNYFGPFFLTNLLIGRY